MRFFTGEEPILQNVPTWRCREPDALAYVLDHLPELVVKEVNGSGGYGMLVGPAATKAEIEAFRAKLMADPQGFIAQPTLALSTCPTFVEQGVAPRHVDLRPFVLTGADGVTDHARRPDPRGADRGLAGGQLQPGRRHQGHLGAGRLMLSRTADNLYWLARYVERADFLARILDAAMRMASLPAGYGGAGAEWDSAIAISDQREAFTAAYGAADEQSVRRLPGLRPQQPVLDPLLPERRPQQRPRGAHRPDHRGVGGGQRRLEPVQRPG